MDETVFQQINLGARLNVTGDDAAVFLQGQFSNELRRAESSAATYGLWLNHKGRVLADSHVLQRGPKRFEVISRTSSASSIRERLETYIIADDVAVEDVTPGSCALVIAGTTASEAVAELGLAVPGLRQFSDAGAAIVVPARVDVRSSWIVIAPLAELTAMTAKLAACGIGAAAKGALERRRIAAGIPAVPDELGLDDLPNEGGLDHDAISYTKGCYLGQEVMARLHNLGQVRRRLFVVRLATTAPCDERTPMFAGDQKTGELRGAVARTEGGAIALAMLSTHLVRPGDTLSLVPGGERCVCVERLAEGRAP